MRKKKKKKKMMRRRRRKLNEGDSGRRCGTLIRHLGVLEALSRGGSLRWRTQG
ncbi:unnamed protein product [Spirodela intermedia]|uniref:Uncharacterized protein n=1 Tax=Spirodela intermedia TaxID=51605 RepID=A0A7I8JLG2_SPIIN|nr:unnamed protein product [Spirodela intermedia]CAA6671027.1 unnamed protein product [Spirodela intermedia]